MVIFPEGGIQKKIYACFVSKKDLSVWPKEQVSIIPITFVTSIYSQQITFEENQVLLASLFTRKQAQKGWTKQTLKN